MRPYFIKINEYMFDENSNKFLKRETEMYIAASGIKYISQVTKATNGSEDYRIFNDAAVDQKLYQIRLIDGTTFIVDKKTVNMILKLGGCKQ